MPAYSVRPKRVSPFNIQDTSFDLRYSEVKGSDILLILFAGFISAGFIPLVSFVICLTKYIFEVNRVRSNRRLDAAACCYEWSLRNAINCRDPEGIVYVLENLLAELRFTNIPSMGPSNYASRDGTTRGIPGYARLQDALTLAKEICFKQDEITSLAGPAGLIQSIEVIRNMLRSEDVDFGMERLRIDNRDVWFWYNWTEEDKLRSLLTQNSRPSTTSSSIDAVSSAIASNPVTPNQSVLTLGDFTDKHLCSYDDFRRSWNKDGTPEHEIRCRYSEWQESKYKQYLKAAVSSQITFKLQSSLGAKPMSSEKLSDLRLNEDIGIEDFLRLRPSCQYLSREQQDAEYIKFLSQSRSGDLINNDTGEDSSTW